MKGPCYWDAYQSSGAYTDLAHWLKHRAYMKDVVCRCIRYEKCPRPAKTHVRGRPKRKIEARGGA